MDDIRDQDDSEKRDIRCAENTKNLGDAGGPEIEMEDAGESDSSPSGSDEDVENSGDEDDDENEKKAMAAQDGTILSPDEVYQDDVDDLYDVDKIIRIHTQVGLATTSIIN